MILRRVIEHVRKQEWTAIVIDFVIVVLGVFVGIQVSNWNAARADNIRAQRYLERIVDDIDADLADYDDRLKFWGEVSRFGETALSYAESRDLGGREAWVVLRSYFQASQVAEFFTTSATWDEMSGAGEIGLIDDLDLRDALARYYTYAGNPALSERPAFRTHVRELIPVDIQTYMWEHCYGSDLYARQWFVDCASPTDEARAKSVIDMLAANDELTGELRYWLSTMNVAARIGRDRVSYATEMKKKVIADLEGEK